MAPFCGIVSSTSRAAIAAYNIDELRSTPGAKIGSGTTRKTQTFQNVTTLRPTNGDRGDHFITFELTK